MDTGTLTKPEWDVMENSRSMGLHSGFSLPFHGPDGQCDIFSMSLRENDPPDPARGVIADGHVHPGRVDAQAHLRDEGLDAGLDLRLRLAGAEVVEQGNHGRPRATCWPARRGSSRPRSHDIAAVYRDSPLAVRDDDVVL